MRQLHCNVETSFLSVVCRGVARNLIGGGINCTISNLSWVKETKQPHKKCKVDWFGGIYPHIPPVATPLVVCREKLLLIFTRYIVRTRKMRWSRLCICVCFKILWAMFLPRMGKIGWYLIGYSCHKYKTGDVFFSEKQCILIVYTRFSCSCSFFCFSFRGSTFISTSAIDW